MILKRAYRLDVVPDGFPLIIRCFQNDSSSALDFSLYASRGTLEIPQDAEVTVRGRNAEGNTFSGACGFAFSRGMPVATVNLTKQMTAKAGLTRLELVIESDGYSLVTATVCLDVRG